MTTLRCPLCRRRLAVEKLTPERHGILPARRVYYVRHACHRDNRRLTVACTILGPLRTTPALARRAVARLYPATVA